MNGCIRDRAMLAGLDPGGAAAVGLALAGGHAVEERRFVQAARFNWARYEQVKRSVHATVCVASMLVTAVVMTVLWWRAAQGEMITPGRWLCGAACGWFAARMFRLGLFVMMAGPQGIVFRQGRLHVSGIGVLKPRDVTGWSITRGAPPGLRSCRCVRVEIRCRWLPGITRRWVMFIVDGPEAARLRRELVAHLGAADDDFLAAEAGPGFVLMQDEPLAASAHEPLPRTTPIRALPTSVWSGRERSLDEVA